MSLWTQQNSNLGVYEWGKMGESFSSLSFQWRLLGDLLVEVPVCWNGQVWRRMNWSFRLGFLCLFKHGKADGGARAFASIRFRFFLLFYDY